MKVIRLLFALYILSLSVFPCSDRNTCADEIKTGITVASTGNHDHASSEQDFCSPFCICSCCATHIQLNHDSDIAFTDLIHNTELTTLYREKSVLNNSDSIWQPPKIG